MPSDLAKKKAAKKKEAAKGRQRTKKSDELEDGEQELQTNGADSNGERTDLNKHCSISSFWEALWHTTLFLFEADVESKLWINVFCFDRCRGFD